MITSKYLPIGTLVIGVLLLAGCLSRSGTMEPEPSLGEFWEIHDPSELVLPLDSYTLTLEDYTTVQLAAWILTRRCVERFGLEYTLSESEFLSNLPPLDHPHERRYGLVDAESAAVRGYNVLDESLDNGIDDGDGWSPSRTEELVVRGGFAGAPPVDVDGNPLPVDGCLGEANRILDEGAPAEPANVNLGTELSREAYQRAESDSRVREVMEEWSACMADRGYTYGSVWEPNDHDWPEPVGEAETAVATADVECKVSTNLVGVWLAVETAYQRRLLEQGTNAEALAELEAFLSFQKQSAARVVAGAR